MSVNRTRKLGVLLLAALFVCASLSVGATVAAAGPTEPLMTLTDLQDKLDVEPDGVVDGYFKTVLKGSTIETLPCEILAITSDDSGASNPQYGLILFRATGAKMESFGGIVAGMSGSPIYVNDGGEDKVIGAISYGSDFTKDGTGLATPIEAMAAIEDYEVGTTQSLSTPVAIGGKLVSDVIVTNDKAAARALNGQAGSLAFRPLAQLSIGGLSPSSRGYKLFSKAAAGKGYDIVPLVGPLGLTKDGFSTDFEPGSGVAATIVRGDFWVGGIGTVTYVDDPTVVAFGHPMNWDGRSAFGLSNAWIDGVWPSSWWPYKIGRPGALRGTITQDRGAGILGSVDQMPAEATLTAQVDVSDAGSASGTSYMPRELLNGEDWGDVVPSAVYATALRAADDYWYKGSAVSTTTVHLRDSVTDEHFTIVRRNVWDDPYDVAWLFPMDSYSLVGELEYAGTNGVAHPDILSVDVEADLTPERNTADIFDVAAPEGLKVGDNPIRVSLMEHGAATTTTVEMTLTIPAGTSTSGYVSVSGAGDGMYFEDLMYEEEGPTSYVDRRTTAQVVAELNSMSANDELVVSFQPYGGMDTPGRSVTATKSTGMYLTGGVDKPTADLEVEVAFPTVNYGGTNYIWGMLMGPERDVSVKLYARNAGETTERYLGTVVAEYDPLDGMCYFDGSVSGVKKNTIVTAVYAGDSYYLGTRAATGFKVRAAVGLTASATSMKVGRTLTVNASVAPTTTTGTVVFDVYRNKRWQQLATRTITTGGKASLSYKPPVGTWSIRARFLGNSVNAAQTSRTVIVKVVK